MFEVGNKYVEGQSVVDVAKNPMRQMREICDETISLGLHDGFDGIILVRKHESSRALRIGNPLGTRLPIFSSAMGKAILSTWLDSELEALIDSITNKNTKQKSTIFQDLEKARDSGIAFDIEESTEGVCAIATALDTGTTRSSASLAIVVPMIRAQGPEWDRLPKLLVAGANAIRDCFQNKKSYHESLLENDLLREWSQVSRAK
jgi:DNA-binding IclR family transcriptional regulator